MNDQAHDTAVYRRSTDSNGASDRPSLREPEARESQLESFRLVCGSMPWILLAAFLSALVMYVVLGDQVTQPMRLIWLACVSAVLAYRLYLLFRWRAKPTTLDNLSQRVALTTILSTTSNIFFGAVGYFVVSPDDPAGALLVIMLLTGMVSGATAAYSHMVVMYLFSLFPLMLPVAVRLFTYDDAAFQVMALLIAGYIPLTLIISHGARAAIMHSIKIRFDNMELLADLRYEKQRAELALASEAKANQAKSKFLAAASHDLRQPLHSLRLFTASLALQTKESEHKELVTKINSSVKSLEELFNALLDISKLDAGTVVANQNHLHLDLLLDQLEEELAPIAFEKGLYLRVHRHGHVVLTDTLLLERLLRNLIINAIRYTHTGGVEVDTLYDADQSIVRILVADTGVGISKSDQSRIFEEFVQLDNADRYHSRGIGLGLSIVKRLCRLLNIDLSIDSTPGEGTCVTARVPAGDRERVPEKQVASEPAYDPLDNLFVLVVDDEEEVCLALESLLETWGCIVMVARSGDEALSQLAEISELPDVIVTDYRLAGDETGGEVVHRVRRQLGYELPAVILTGDISSERLREINSLGIPALHKPCDPDTLRATIVSQTVQRAT